MRPVWSEARQYARFARKLRESLRHPVTAEQARAIVRRRLEAREANFLEVVERAVFGNPRSPYLPLLARAGCALGDLRETVRARGLEPALEALRAAGVYVTAEEAKGRTPIVRGDLVVPVRDTDFDNPLLRADYGAETGGTTGPVIRVGVSVENLLAEAPNALLAFEAHGLRGLPMGQWRGILPNTSAVNNLFRSGAFIGQRHVRWFSPSPMSWTVRRLKPRALTMCIVGVGWLSGVRLPWPRYVPLDRADVVARWAAQTAAAHGGCVLRCVASTALRVALAAQEHGLSLAGVTMIAGGEPITPAKAAGIARSGARWVPAYAFTEGGNVGFGCARPVAPDDVHVYRDLHAIIQAPRRIGASATTVPALYFSSLSPTARKILLNAENGDYAILEPRACGCPLEAHGFTAHLREIRSFGLLTSEGTMVVATDMVRVLEEVLPARFGGSALDYQMVEEEDDAGFTRLRLLIHPRVAVADEADVVRTIVQHLTGLSRNLWTEVGTIRVVRAAPALTAQGKLVPLHLARRPTASTVPPDGPARP
ncbi:MAG: hypothetical protein QN174_00380 [Armatimonadota bacterium]|nr:hypothetical protein [Armatimonadota bacterium]MDR7454783.1 hypothetical protein [Armatimonadota bacterium]MDR7495403.1 hypothetical protein [Armatimonadota bacterium]